MSSQAVTSRRLNALILPVCLAGLGVLSAAAYIFATTEHSARALISLAALTAAATLAERFPVPINAEAGGGVTSLTFVFAVAAIVLFGWAAGALLLLAATAIVQLAQHRPLQRISFNVAVLALVALAAGVLIAPIQGDSVGAVIARVVVAATADNIVNIVLISAAIALSTNQPYLKLMKTHVRATIVPFAFMASAALMLVVIVSSVYLRLNQAGLSCSDWPACYGRVDPQAAATSGLVIARFAHRIAASAVGVVLLAAVLIGATQRPWLGRQVGIAAAAFAIALYLAALGAQFPASASEIPSPAVILANLGGGFALLGLLWLLRLTMAPPLVVETTLWLKLAATLALLAVIAQIVLGALVSAKFAALACPAFPVCGSDWPTGTLLQSLDPFADRVLGPDGAIARPAALAALHWAHRVGALIVFALGAQKKTVEPAELAHRGLPCSSSLLLTRIGQATRSPGRTEPHTKIFRAERPS